MLSARLADVLKFSLILTTFSGRYGNPSWFRNNRYKHTRENTHKKTVCFGASFETKKIHIAVCHYYALFIFLILHAILYSILEEKMSMLACSSIFGL